MTSVICTGGEKRKVRTVPTPPASAFQSLSGSSSMRASQGKEASSEVQSTRRGCNSAMSISTVVVVVVVEDAAVPSPLRKTFTARASRATVRMTPASTIRARAPAVVRSMGWGATGRGAWERRAPQESQWRLKGGLWVPHEGQGTPVGGPPLPPPPWPAPPWDAARCGGSRRWGCLRARRARTSRRRARRACRPRSSPGVVAAGPHGVPAPSRVLCHGCRVWRLMHWLRSASPRGGRGGTSSAPSCWARGPWRSSSSPFLVTLRR